MFAEMKHTLRRLRGQLIGWGIGLALYGLMMVSLFDTIIDMPELAELMKQYPPELMAFFGGAIDLSSPVGYFDTYYSSYMTLIIGIFTIGACAKLLAGDEENGVLDLVMSYPVSRTGLFWGRLLGFVAATAILLMVSWLSWALPSGGTSLGLSWIELLRPFVPLFVQLMVLSTLALLFSMFLPAGRLAGMLTGAIMVGNFLMLGLSELNDDLKRVVKFTPLYYDQGGEAIRGINWEWQAWLMLASLVCALLAWLLFQRRDIRVGGERSWRLSDLKLLLKRN